jgi:hypothetical protein
MFLIFDIKAFDLRRNYLSSPMSKFIIKLKQVSSFGSPQNDTRANFQPLTFRLSTFALLLTYSLSLLTIQCGLDIEDPSRPSAPIWVQKSLPEEWPERGIDAHEGGGIFIEWEALLPSESIMIIQVFRAEYDGLSDSLGDFNLLAEINTESTYIVEYHDYSARERIRYYYKLRGIDTSNNFSLFSDSLSYLLLPPVAIHTMSPNGVESVIDEDRRLVWYYNLTIEMEEYCLTVLDEVDSLVIRELFQPANYDGGAESFALSANLPLISGNVYKWRIDTVANYLGAYETTSSESSWAIFKYLE